MLNTTMSISPTPFFRIGHAFPLFGSFSFSGQAWKSMPEDRVLVFSRGRWALEKLALNFIRSKRKTGGIVFIPEYFCEVSLTPLRMSNFNLHFYRITSQLKPDIDHLNALIKKHGAPDILLYVHYFGFPSKLDNVAGWCEKRDVLLVEDAAHTMIPILGIGDNNCPTIYTPWKFFGTLEGALLVLPQKMANLLEEPAPQKPDSSYPWRWVGKRVVHSMIGRMGLPLHRLREMFVKEPDKSEPLSCPKSPVCGSFSMAILARFERRLEQIRAIRELNYRRLDETFSSKNISAERFFHTLPAKIGPYVYPLRIRNGRCKDIMVSLNLKGIPAQPWSDLSPEVANLPEFPLSNALRREILTLPIHQHLTESQTDWMAQEVISRL